MTVALDNIQGMGWDGVADIATGSEIATEEKVYDDDGQRGVLARQVVRDHVRKPLEELGQNFYQRVFSSKERLDPATGKIGVSLVGKAPPFDFPLRLAAENEQSHVEVSQRENRASHKPVAWPINSKLSKAEQRNGVRTITGEALHKPVPADLRGASHIDPADIPATSMMKNRKPAGHYGGQQSSTAISTITTPVSCLRGCHCCQGACGRSSFPRQKI